MMLQSSHGKTTLRVRRLYGLSRPCARRSSFRDTEARRGSPRGCRKESAPTWAKAEAQTRPRFKRRSLETRFSDLPCYFRISEPFAYDLRNGHIKAVCIGHGIILGRAIVVAPCLFVQIAKQ